MQWVWDNLMAEEEGHGIEYNLASQESMEEPSIIKSKTIHLLFTWEGDGAKE